MARDRRARPEAGSGWEGMLIHESNTQILAREGDLWVGYRNSMIMSDDWTR